MYMNKYLLSFLYIFSFGIILYSCRDEISSDCPEVVIDMDDIAPGDVSVADVISEVQIIPLEDRKECMLSHVEKLNVTEHGFIITDMSVDERILLFGSDGKFKKRIGRMGHGKGEYSSLYDTGFDFNCDTIALSVNEGILFYNCNGKHIGTRKVEGNAFVKQIAKCPIGYVCSTDYSGSDNLLSVYNNDFEIQKLLLKAVPNIVCIPPLEGNHMRVNNGKIIYCSYFESSIYSVDCFNDCYMKRYRFVSKDMLTPEKAQKEDCYDKPLDCLYNFYVVNDSVIGDIMHGNILKRFVLNTKDDTFSVGIYDSGMPLIKDYRDGYYYSILEQDELLDIVEKRYGPSNYMDSLIREDFITRKLVISEKSNYVILKMKKR